MNTAYCDIDLYQEAPPSLEFDEKLSVAAALAISLVFSGGLAWLAVHVLTSLQA